jgi:peroxiredoxin
MDQWVIDDYDRPIGQLISDHNRFIGEQLSIVIDKFNDHNRSIGERWTILIDRQAILDHDRLIGEHKQSIDEWLMISIIARRVINDHDWSVGGN